WFVDLVNIKKCNTYGGNIFILEEFSCGHWPCYSSHDICGWLHPICLNCVHEMGLVWLVV
ncbi:MAP kinase-activating death domain protein, partial [Trichinella spiralis]|uniref:MAP kinase-activating death domain protein n=1 Tax=Trichinella spiralis TaxID=6334 RepID=UPI0001EFE05D